MNRIEALNMLGLDSDATQADIKAAYRECAQILHPDRFVTNAKLQNRATEQFKRLQDAYELLTSGKARRSSGSGSSSSGSGAPRSGSYSKVEAQLAGLAAARTQLIAHRDALSDERRNALVMIVAGGLVALAARRIVVVAGLASALAIYGIVSFMGSMRNISTIDERLKEMDMQRRRLEEELEED